MRRVAAVNLPLTVTIVCSLGALFGFWHVVMPGQMRDVIGIENYWVPVAVGALPLPCLMLARYRCSFVYSLAGFVALTLFGTAVLVICQVELSRQPGLEFMPGAVLAMGAGFAILSGDPAEFMIGALCGVGAVGLALVLSWGVATFGGEDRFGELFRPVVFYVLYGPSMGQAARFAPVPPAQPTHRCASCDYDLTGNVSGICPECGTRIPGRR